MSAALHTPGEAVASVPAPSTGELLTVAADVVAMVNGRASYVTISDTGAIAVHVECQADAEHLARLLRLGHVEDFSASDERDGFSSWSGQSWTGVRFSVMCPLIGQARPVRAFPVRPGEFEQFDAPVPYALAVA
ncbi:hypothetical protein [Promicromonospora panici]|uniref:hypothetical protein n=1 Tax=Promicromonospora panici TaxID=2219658 RepID=UPI00101BEEEF|nr:hypothetical protein [Promicromonospora panici]